MQTISSKFQLIFGEKNLVTVTLQMMKMKQEQQVVLWDSSYYAKIWSRLFSFSLHSILASLNFLLAITLAELIISLI